MWPFKKKKILGSNLRLVWAVCEANEKLRQEEMKNFCADNETTKIGKIGLEQSFQEKSEAMNTLARHADERWREAIEKNKALGKENEALKRENESLKAKIQEYRELIFQLGKSNITKV